VGRTRAVGDAKSSLTEPLTGRIRYVLYRSYVLLAMAPIEHISERIRAQLPSSEPQRIDQEAYESPALPLSYSAAVVKITEHDQSRQPPALQHITIQQHITFVHRNGSEPTANRSPTGNRSLRLARMSNRGKREVHHASLIVDGVPDPPRAGHLELPLLEDSSANRASREIAPEGVLPLAPSPRISPQRCPGRQRRSGSLGTHPLPALDRGAVAKAEVPFAWRRRRRNAVAALGHGSAGRRSGHSSAIAGQRSLELGR
jgi:hypothetical protein